MRLESLTDKENAVVMGAVVVLDGGPGRRRPDPGTRVVDQVYEHIRELLVSGRVEPGSRLNLLDVSRRLHVSNTPVRRALARLVAEGLVSSERNRGFFASPLLDTRTIDELYDFRLMVEPTAAGRAARAATPERLEVLTALVDPAEVRLLIADAGQPEGCDRLLARDHDFHGTIAEFAGNRLVASHLATTFDALRQFTRCSRSSAPQAWDEHRAIVAAIAAADAEKAALAMRAHLMNTREQLRSAFGRQSDRH